MNIFNLEIRGMTMHQIRDNVMSNGYAYSYNKIQDDTKDHVMKQVSFYIQSRTLDGVHHPVSRQVAPPWWQVRDQLTEEADQ